MLLFFSPAAELTVYLLDSGADLSVKTSKGETIMQGAVHGNVPSIVNTLIARGNYTVSRKSRTVAAFIYRW